MIIEGLPPEIIIPRKPGFKTVRISERYHEILTRLAKVKRRQLAAETELAIEAAAIAAGVDLFPPDVREELNKHFASVHN